MTDDNAQERYIRALQATVTYQVGDLVIRARSSLKAALCLPWRLYQLHRIDQRASAVAAIPSFDRPQVRAFPPALQQGILTLDLINAETANGASLCHRLSESGLSKEQQAASLLKAAELLVSSRPETGASFARQAMKLAPSTETIEQAAFILYRAGSLSEPATFLRKHSSGRRRAMRDRILDEHTTLSDGPTLPSASIMPAQNLSANRILYVSHLSLPHHTSGYATRTHSFLLTLQRRGFEVVCVTRPGYPWDRRDSRAMVEAAPEQEIEGVRYLHLRGPSVGEIPPSTYVAQAAEQLESVIERERPALVVAGSNHVNALPALMAARSTGRPFYYDIRGLWEFTSASKLAGWEHTERFHLSRQLETRIAREATGVFAISSPVKEELTNRGVSADRISLLPNGVDTDRFTPGPPPTGLRQRLAIPPESSIFGFIGSLEVYEGIEDLIRSFSLTLAEDLDAYLVIVGDGPAAQSAGDLVGKLGIAARVRFIGRIPFDEVLQYYRLCDIFVYPRIDIPLTRLVPALKPLEAMATGKPVIISDLPALAELVGGPRNALLTPPGDIDTLAQQMERLARDEPERAQLSETGQRHARSRTWETSTSSAACILSEQTTPLDGVHTPG
jgi:glycosyltransferase involved in cell wall biosynthesis